MWVRWTQRSPGLQLQKGIVKYRRHLPGAEKGLPWLHVLVDKGGTYREIQGDFSTT